MIQKGMRVKSVRRVGRASTIAEGVVLKIVDGQVCVEFDEDIGGHNGGPELTGKNGHCWWLEREYLQVLEARNNLEALGFLKERGL